MMSGTTSKRHVPIDYVVYYNSKNEVFLTTRSLKKKIFPNCVDCACSFHVQYGQTYDEAARIELLEETRIKGNPEYLGKFLLDEHSDRMIVATYRIHHDGELTLDPGEAVEGRFYTLEEADDIVKTEKTTPWLRGAWKIFKEKGPEQW